MWLFSGKKSCKYMSFIVNLRQAIISLGATNNSVLNSPYQISQSLISHPIFLSK